MRSTGISVVKLEGRMMSARVRSVLVAVDGGIGVVDGWGGMYMRELIDAGICGVMPGLGVSDLLQQILEIARAGDKGAAYGLFQRVLPQISYSLQSLDLFTMRRSRYWLPRRFDQYRGSGRHAHQRADRDHINFLNSRIFKLAASRRPRSVRE